MDTFCAQVPAQLPTSLPVRTEARHLAVHKQLEHIVGRHKHGHLGRRDGGGCRGGRGRQQRDELRVVPAKDLSDAHCVIGPEPPAKRRIN